MKFSAQMARDWNPAWWQERRVARAVMVRLPGTELDTVVPTLFPKDGPVSGVGMKHRGVAPAEEESSGRRERAEVRSSGILDSSRCYPIAMAGH